ncbi:uncharacterized protein TNCV_255751 [Trichonephila clavipes]|nr:uncharacterized protein TNCV_255751 [Trichonephila clavipes]
MKRAIWAIYFHKLSTEDNPQHALCPLGEDSWCGYNRSIVTGEFYIHKHSLPESILLKVKKVFRDLTEKDLLKKCLHGRTQNPNESFNKCIWERIPKTVFVGIETFKFGVMDAVICFNDGYAGRRTVLLARWIDLSVPLEIVGCSEHEKLPTHGKPGLERPGGPRGERIEGSCGKHLWTPQ